MGGVPGRERAGGQRPFLRPRWPVGDESGELKGELRIEITLLPPVDPPRAAFQSSDSSVTAFMVANVSPTTAAAARTDAPNRAVRMLGRYQLLRLLGKSAQTMLWLGLDTRGDVEVMLALPRLQPPDPDALNAWVARVGRTARLKHPRLARILDVGEHERWPYAIYERGDFVTWAERLTAKGLPGQELTQWSVQVLQGLAFAHEAGSAHRDLQPYSLLVDDLGNVKLLGLEIVDAQSFPQSFMRQPADADGHQAAMDERRHQRQSAEIDVLAMGLVMHQLLAGAAPLDEPDIARVVGRLPPFGHEMVRLPWTVPRPIAEPLRAIVNRATDRQERQRYRSARTFERALDGWLQASNEQDAGPITLLLGRMRSVGLLPAMPGGADRAARLAMMESGHTNELSNVVLQDFALSFEMIRMVNFAQSKAGHSGSGAVLAIHRAIAMVGLDGVRQAALSLRPWPGPLNDGAATALEELMLRVKRAGAMARALQPAGYDHEVVFLITALQNLGWLVVQYHFPDEALQIRRLMQPSAAQKEGEPDEQGMSAEGASFAVLGIDIDTLGSAVMHHWGLDDSVQHMVRRAPPTGPIHTPTSDVDMLRLVASCANDVVDAVSQPPRQAIAAVQRVAQRYGRALDICLKDIQDALQPASATGDRAAS
jgi:HD-like signal output (HDOD) protein